MIGFFEYQYQKYKKSHLRNLVALAKADGHFHDNEKDFLYDIGLKYGLKPRQIEEIFQHTGYSELHIPDTHAQKMGLLYDTVGMMLADGVIDDSEMVFCNDMVKQFNYQPAVLDTMIDAIQNKKISGFEDWESFLEESKKFEK
jgi:uncharacterized membrane protein YebE (DUF533 family)